MTLRVPEPIWDGWNTVCARVLAPGFQTIDDILRRLWPSLVVDNAPALAGLTSPAAPGFPAGDRPGVVSAGPPTTAPTPGHPDGIAIFRGGFESDGPDLTQGPHPVAASRSDFPGCDCAAFQAADLDDHAPECGARSWARTYRIVSEHLCTPDVFAPLQHILDDLAARITNALHA